MRTTFGLGQVGDPGVQGGGSVPSAEATVHVPTSIAAARNSLIIRFTLFLQCAIRTGESVPVHQTARGKCFSCSLSGK